MQTRYSLILAVTLLFGCGGTTSSSKADGYDPGHPDGASEKGGQRTSSKSKKGKPLRFDSVSPKTVSALQFVGNRLAIGFSDGALALVDVQTGKVRHAKVAKFHAVAAVSPTGDFALLASNPPVVVNTQGELILQMNTVPSFESAVFGNDGVTMYVADKMGKVRIWGQPHSFEEDQHKEQLENYLNRQAPDFHVEFGPIRGPIHITDTNKLVVVGEDGTVRLWDPTRPSGSRRIMKVGGGARSVASADGHIFITSVTGAFKVGVEDGTGYLPWSKDARADYVTSSPMTAGVFYTLDSGQIQARNTQSGEVTWSTKIPDGRPCGIDISEDANTLAACIGNFTATFDARDGSPLAYGYRADGDLQWKR